MEFLAVIGTGIEHQPGAGGHLEQAARRQRQVAFLFLDGPLQGRQIGEERDHRFTPGVLPVLDGQPRAGRQGGRPVAGRIALAQHEDIGGQQPAVEFRPRRRVVGGAFERFKQRAVRHVHVLL
ncbi:hypothetical protein Y5W_01858 [Alcanivorax sp. 521-1]|uniref:Uncharacterized protein n=1 Tax=Alloalcanivorax profundimaris TaxID=2735259 RepID=A0ABS0AR12_9GAMM|nr:hypothetical protein [Alloalcanivorax profundimaris]MBF5056564.1 hypothetical protein [Alloalcanivorax profundimaris]